MAESKITKPLMLKKVDISQRCNTTSNLEYTGVSYTIPANSYAALHCGGSYYANSPKTIVLCESSSTSYIFERLAEGQGQANAIIVTGNSPQTVYIWYSSDGSGYNGVWMNGYILS